MLIGGIQTLTLLDYPGKVACLVFTAGCNMRCGYCHNYEFVLPEKIKELQNDFIPEEKVFSFLETREGFLDGVAITGGEPTVHPDLPDFIRQIKKMGFLVKLDTNGTNPDMLKKLYDENLLDYVAMDIKASREKYDVITGAKLNFSDIERSKKLIQASGKDYEFRTTVVQGFHDEEEIDRIASFCEGARQYTLQNFRSVKVLDSAYKRRHGFSDAELQKLKKIAQKHVKKVLVLN